MSDLEGIDFEDDISWDNSSNVNDKKGKKISDLVVSRDDNDTKGLEENHLKVLSDCFGHTKFRSLQWKIIRSIILDKKDVCAIMATGYGKSLCYQFPSVYSGGITLVISPLISLMEDQVLSLKMSNIRACLLGSAQTQTSQVLSDIMSNVYRIIYATPEFCTGDMGTAFLQKMNDTLNVDLLAIDEAHCVSQWGHDFRVKYRHLSQIRKILQNVPVLAVTATATQDVRNDIISSLKLRNPNIYCSGFDRPNLCFEVVTRKHSEPIDNLRPYMVRGPDGLSFAGPTIIYCLTRNKTQDVANNLKGHGVNCLVYHAAISIGQRKKAHEQFVRDQVKVIVATIAFGMGIDKPDVRMVIHYGASKDVESYYQEVGRAGRDGLPSRCILLHSNTDFKIHENLRDHGFATSAQQKEHREKMSKIMQRYMDTLGCRRKFILDYFQDEISNNNVPKNICCDNCKMEVKEGSNFSQNYSGLDDTGKYDISEDAKLLLGLIQSLNGRYGMVIYVLTLRGSKNSKVNNMCMKNSLYGKGKDQTEEWWKNIGLLLEREGYLKKVRHNTGTFSYSTVDVSSSGAKILTKLNCDPNMELRVTPTKEMSEILKQQAFKNKKAATQSNDWNTTRATTTSSSTSQLDNKVVDLQTFKVVPKPEIKKKEEEEDPEQKKYRMDLYNKLLYKRSEIADKFECMPYMAGSNMALMQMSKMRPTNLKQLTAQNYDGFTASKIEHIGQIYVDFIKDYCAKNPPPGSSGCEEANEFPNDSQSDMKMDTTTQRLDDFHNVLMENIEDWDDWNDDDDFQNISTQTKTQTKTESEILEPPAKFSKIDSSGTKEVLNKFKSKKNKFSWD